jgi:hypothetical protein
MAVILLALSRARSSGSGPEGPEEAPPFLLLALGGGNWRLSLIRGRELAEGGRYGAGGVGGELVVSHPPKGGVAGWVCGATSSLTLFCSVAPSPLAAGSVPFFNAAAAAPAATAQAHRQQAQASRTETEDRGQAEAQATGAQEAGQQQPQPA